MLPFPLARKVCGSERHAGVCDQTQADSRRSVSPMAMPDLVLFTESLDVRFAVWIEQFLAALLPRCFEFGRGDVPVRPALLDNGTQVLAEIFQSGPAEEPVAVVDLVNDKTGSRTIT